MTHTEYIELTELLRKLAGDADLLREGRVYVSVGDHGEILIMTRAECDQTKYSKPIRDELLTRTQNNVARAVDIMAKCVDGWVAYNQDRADNKLTVTDQDRALYEGMTGFMSATDKPIASVGGVYTLLRSRCRSWMDLATTWFPELYPAHVQKFIQSEHYARAVGDRVITPPLTVTNGRIADLARVLYNGYFTIRQKDIDEGNNKARNDWQMWDGVFKDSNGTPITNTQLSDAFKH